MRDRSRRDVLCGFAAVTAGALAGCDGVVLGSDSPSRFVRWAPAPAETPQSDGWYSILGVKPSDLTAVDAPWTDAVEDSLPRSGPLRGALSVDEVEHLQSMGTTVAFDGGFDAAAVRETIQNDEFRSREAIAGYRTAQAPDGTLVATTDDRIVMGRRRDRLAAFIGAHDGDVDRLSAASERTGTLLDHLPTATVAAARVHGSGVVGFPGSMAEGIAVDVESGRTTATGVVVFESGAADPEGVAEWAATADPIDPGDVETRTRGDAVVATATVATSGLEGLWTGFPEPAETAGTRARTPQIAFAFDYEATGEGQGHLTITHQGGDVVPSDQLLVEGAGFAPVSDVDQSAAGPWQGSTGEDGQVAAGDSVTVGVESDYETTIVWQDSDSATSATLAMDDGPDA